MSRLRFVEAEKAEQHNVTKACQLLEFSTSAFYDWHKHRPSARALALEQLGERIKAIFEATRGTDGWPRVHSERGVKACMPTASGWPSSCARNA